MIPWLHLFLWPGLAAALAGIFWLYYRGVRRSRLMASLWLMAVLWAGTILMVSGGWFEAALFTGGIAFTLSMLLTAYLVWRSTNQAANLDRLQCIVERRSDRVTALGHEIRTPLAMIKGASDLLLEGGPGPLTTQQLTFLQTISQNSEHLNILAEDLLTQARIEAGLFKLRLEPVDIKQLMRSCIKAARRYTNQRFQTIKLDDPQVIEPIYADPRLVSQVMANLLQNASRHTTHGGHIYVSVAENDAGLVISVTDDGAGMSREERLNLFKRFSSGRPLGDGTGMGMVITRQIIELHGGQIFVDTTLGRGTTVLFTLPRWRGEGASEKKQAAPA